jgi:hypothetical protein
LIVRHVESKPAETVFSLKPSCRHLISKFEVFSIDVNTSLMAVMVGASDICVMRLNHQMKTFKQIELDLKKV